MSTAEQNTTGMESNDQTRENPTFHSLPDELQAEIFSYLPMKEIFSVCLVCKRWNSLIMNADFMWKIRCKGLESHTRVENDRAKGHSWKVNT